MTTLTIYPDKDPANPVAVTSDPVEIAAELNKVGVLFERWKAGAELAANAMKTSSPPTRPRSIGSPPQRATRPST